MPVLAPHGVVATSNPLAAQAGLRMLLAGGNAVDAAIATATVLTVVEPWVNGIGSDAFAIVWDGEKLHGLNASGKAPAAHTPELFAKLGHTERVPNRGWLSVTVPGAPAAWRDLHERFGRLPFEQRVRAGDRLRAQRLPAGPRDRLRLAAGATRQPGEHRRRPDARLVPGPCAQNYIENCRAPSSEGWFETFMPEGRIAHARRDVDSARPRRHAASASRDEV